MSHATLMRAGLVLLLLMLMAVAPVLLTRDLVTGLFLTLLFITLAANYDILGGFLGYVNLGQGAFFGLGAYLTFILLTSSPMRALGLVAVPTAGLMAIGGALLFAWVVAYPLFRLQGAYFAMATFGLVLLLRQLILNFPRLTGGSYGLYIPAAYYLELRWAYYLSLLLGGSAVAINFLISRGRLGIAFGAIKDSELGAAAIGIDLFHYKRLGLLIAAVPSAAAGGVFGLFSGYIDVEAVWGFEKTLFPVIIAMLGGSGRVWGPAVGGLIMRGIDIGLKNYLVLPVPALGIYGLLLMLLGLFMPEGLLNTVSALSGQPSAVSKKRPDRSSSTRTHLGIFG